MEIFLTGPTGFIGTAVVAGLRQQGHTLAGLAHTSQVQALLEGWGVRPVVGTLAQPDLVAQAARAAEATIHLGQIGGPDFPANDAAVVAACLAALAGTGKRFLYTSGAAVPGDSGSMPGDETFPLDPHAPMAWRGVTEQRVLTAQGVHGLAIRPTMVHGPGRAGMASFFQQGLQREGVARYVGTGEYRWSTVHIDDIADLYVRVVAQAPAGSVYIAASDEVVQFKQLAELVAGGAERTASWPVEQARPALGLLAALMTTNAVWSGAKARQTLGWQPHGPPLLAELAAGGAR